jgi:predicted HicB family RNase H-like nuclease
MTDEHSGKLLLRLPPWLHVALAKAAKDQRVSMNQYAVAAIAVTIGMNHPHAFKDEKALKAEES